MAATHTPVTWLPHGCHTELSRLAVTHGCHVLSDMVVRHSVTWPSHVCHTRFSHTVAARDVTHTVVMWFVHTVLTQTVVTQLSHLVVTHAVVTGVSHTAALLSLRAHSVEGQQAPFCPPSAPPTFSCPSGEQHGFWPQPPVASQLWCAPHRLPHSLSDPQT